MKECKKIIIICGLIFFPLLLQAQEKEKNSYRIGFEFGANSFFGETILPDQIRESKSLYEYDDFRCGLPLPEQTIDNFYGGIKLETFFRNNRLGFTTGLRFSELSSEINTNWRYNYFIWLLHQNETNTDYLRIQKIKQKNYYLGIPLELRYLLRKRNDSFFNPYIKLGAAVNYCLSTNNHVTFYSSEMNKYAGELDEQIKKPKSFYAFVYPAFGFRFGKLKNVWFNIEADFPGFLIGDKVQPFIRTDFGMGMQLSLQIPLSK